MTSPSNESATVTITDKGLAIARQVQIVIALAVCAAVLVLAAWLMPSSTRASNDPESASRTPASKDHIRLTKTQLATIAIEPVSLAAFRDQVHAEGKIVTNGDRTTQVFSPYSGRVRQVLAAPGDRVKAGAPLFAIEANEYVQAQSDYLSAIAQLKLVRNSEERRRAAFEAKGGSLQDWQQAQADLAAAEANTAAARNKLQIFGRSDQEIDAIERAAKPVAMTYVLSPVDGVVTDRQIGPGQYLQAGQTTPVYTVADLSNVWVMANVSETDAPAIEPGQAAEVHVLALPNQTFNSKITWVGAALDPNTRRVPVRATLDNAQGKLRPEMFATFSIFTSSDSQAPAVRQDAVVYEGDSARVWAVEKDGEISLRAIRVGRTQLNMLEVIAGLQAGDKVVTHGSLFIDRAARPD